MLVLSGKGSHYGVRGGKGLIRQDLEMGVPCALWGAASTALARGLSQTPRTLSKYPG